MTGKMRMCPVYKGNDRRDMGNYRPISILPIISKVFEKEVFQQLYHYLKVILFFLNSSLVSALSTQLIGFDSNVR